MEFVELVHALIVTALLSVVMVLTNLLSVWLLKGYIPGKPKVKVGQVWIIDNLVQIEYTSIFQENNSEP